ncbi:MAG TPA: hypothetical protein VIS07_22975 [Candidatus Binatia bacterium]
METSSFSKAIAAIVAALVLALPAAASADSTGIAGKIIGFQHFGTTSDDAGMVAGKIYVDEQGSTRVYAWGGSLCGSHQFDVDERQLLATAISHRMSIVPRYKIGSGNTRCLVAFTLTRPAFVDRVQ